MLPKPPDGYWPKDEALATLDRFVNGDKYSSLTGLPKRAEPAHVDEFVRKTLDAKELKLRQVQRCGVLMRFYDLRQRTVQLLKLLDPPPGPAPRRFPTPVLTLVAVAIVCDMGDPAQQQKAVDAYKTVLSAPDLPNNTYEQAVDTFFYLPQNADPKIVSTPLDDKVKALQPKAANDDDVAVQMYALEDLSSQRFQTVLKAKKRKHEIAAIPDPHKRRQELGRCYLLLERYPYVDMQTWAWMMIQRDCAAGDPADLAAEFVQGFDLIRSQAAKRQLAPGDEKDLNGFVTRCAHGVEFYLGKLSPDQMKYWREHNNEDQLDVLHWDHIKSPPPQPQKP
jgi:hypothetical protein